VDSPNDGQLASRPTGDFARRSTFSVSRHFAFEPIPWGHAGHRDGRHTRACDYGSRVPARKFYSPSSVGKKNTNPKSFIDSVVFASGGDAMSGQTIRFPNSIGVSTMLIMNHARLPIRRGSGAWFAWNLDANSRQRFSEPTPKENQLPRFSD